MNRDPSLLVVHHAALGSAARDWDEQHVRLAGAAAQVADLPASCFTPRVAPVAALFCQRWSAHLEATGQETEVRADGLRDALREVVGADEAVGLGALLLQRALTEVR